MVRRQKIQELQALLAQSPTDNFLSLSIRVGLDPRKDYINADLADVDFSGRDLRGANFTKANLEGANLRGVGT